MYILLITIHVTVCLMLIASILLQAGRGGGLAEMFGGGETTQSVLGTQAPAILKKATTIAAIAFLLTSLLLGIVTARRGRSLFDRTQFPAAEVVPQQEGSPAALPADLPEKVTPPAAESASQPEEASPISESK